MEGTMKITKEEQFKKTISKIVKSTTLYRLMPTTQVSSIDNLVIQIKKLIDDRDEADTLIFVARQMIQEAVYRDHHLLHALDVLDFLIEKSPSLKKRLKDFTLREDQKSEDS